MSIELQPSLRILIPPRKPVRVADVTNLTRIDAPGIAVGIDVAVPNSHPAIGLVLPPLDHLPTGIGDGRDVEVGIL